jgi:hypothetical protein
MLPSRMTSRSFHCSFISAYPWHSEYGNSGDGASGTRASFATKLSAKVSIATVLGSGYASWVDTSFPIA